MGRQVLMICTVGTSLMGRNKIPDVLSKSNAAYDEKALFDPDCDDALLDFMQNIPQPDKELRENVFRMMRNPEMGTLDLKDCKFPNAETETLIRWLKEDDNGRNVSKLSLVLLPSKDKGSILTAHATCVCLKRLMSQMPDRELICDRGPDGIRPLDIKVDNRENFLPSISALFGELDKLTAKPEGEVVLCATGGYKAVAGFAMMYAQLHSLPCLYTFEGSPQAYEVMSVPLGYAYASMDEEINMLKAIEKDVAVNTDALPRWVQDSRALAGSLLKSYEAARMKPYGAGEYLFNRLRNCGDKGKEWADYLQSLLTHNWSQLWAGDQIPETVEHSRRHSKRLMEFAANLFRCAPGPLKTLGFDDGRPELLAVLIASIYLHDIGHTALSYPLLEDRSGPADIFPLGLFPSSVREVHHLLTGKLLRSGGARARYFTRREGGNDGWMTEILTTCVPLVSEHHRGYTALKNEAATLKEGHKVRLAGELLFGKENFEETLRPLEERYAARRKDCPIEPEHLLNLAALTRIIDGCDVQADRVVSEDYLEYRNRRSDDEARALKTQLQGLRDCLSGELRERLDILDSGEEDSSKAYDAVYPLVFRDLKELRKNHGSWERVMRNALPEFTALSLANRVAFKGEQRFHFGKHQNASFVLPVFEAPNTVTVQVFPNSELPGFSKKILEGICGDIRGEYVKVQEVLDPTLVFGAKIAGETE